MLEHTCAEQSEEGGCCWWWEGGGVVVIVVVVVFEWHGYGVGPKMEDSGMWGGNEAYKEDKDKGCAPQAE
jgi:hypothetical protein